MNSSSPAQENSTGSRSLVFLYSLLDRILAFFRILVQAGIRFFNDSCFIRANAIAYSIVISIIPLLTVLIKYAAVDRAMIRLNLSRFLAAYGIADTSPLFTILDEILLRANAIAGVGSIFMIYAATNMLRHLEDSFNYIYRAESERPMLYRFALYISSLVVLPGLIILFSSAMRYYVDRITPPRVLSVLPLDDGGLVFTGNHGILQIRYGEKIKTVNLANRVGVNAPFRNLTIDTRSRIAGRPEGWIIPGESARVGNEGRNLESRDFSNISATATRGKAIHIITETGIHFYSLDGGEIWSYDIFSFKTDLSTRNPILEDLLILPDGHLLILGTTGSSSLLISREKDRWRWHPLDSVYHRILALENGNPENPSSLLMVTGNGRIQTSSDEGESWSGPRELPFGNRSVRINDASKFGENGMVYGGDGGSLWIRENRQSQFPDIRARYDQSVSRIHIGSDGKGFLYGSNHLFRFTMDGGRTWNRPEQEAFEEVSFHSHRILPGGSTILVGDDEMILTFHGQTVSKTRDRSGYPLIHAQIDSMERYPAARAWFLRVLLLGVLLSIVFSIFFFMYIFLPNAKVELFAASIGSSLTSLTLLAFVMGFRFWLDAFASTRYIYGVWAVIPVGMIVILISNQIILFGLEVAYIIQNPRLYRKHGRKTTNPDESLYGNSIALLVLTYRHLYRKNRPLSDRELRNYFHQDMETVRRVRNRMVRGKFLSYNSSTGEYFPVRPPGEIPLREIQNHLFSPMVSASPVILPRAIQEALGELQDKFIRELNRIGEDLTLRDLIGLYDARDPSKNLPPDGAKTKKEHSGFLSGEGLLKKVRSRKKKKTDQENPPS